MYTPDHTLTIGEVVFGYFARANFEEIKELPQEYKEIINTIDYEVDQEVSND